MWFWYISVKLHPFLMWRFRMQLDDWVLCRIYKKSSKAQRVGKERESPSYVEEVIIEIFISFLWACLPKMPEKFEVCFLPNCCWAWFTVVVCLNISFLDSVGCDEVAIICYLSPFSVYFSWPNFIYLIEKVCCFLLDWIKHHGMVYTVFCLHNHIPEHVRAIKTMK